MRKDRDDNSVDPTQAALVVTYGNTSRKRKPLDKDVVVLGRMQGCDLPLMSPDVAPVHCVIARLADGWYIRDCSGHLGTRVNGKSVNESPLVDEDHLQIGPFNFKVYLPPEDRASTPVVRRAEPDPTYTPAVADRSEEIEQLQQSRANLVRLAQAYRLREQTHHETQSENRAELEQMAKDIAAERYDLERDWEELETTAISNRARERDLEQAEKILHERAERFEKELSASRTSNEDIARQRAGLTSLADKLKREAQLLDEDRTDLEKINMETERGKIELQESQARIGTDLRQSQELLRDLARREEQLAEQSGILERRSQELDAFSNNPIRERQEYQNAGQTMVTFAPEERLALSGEIETLTSRLQQADREISSLRKEIDNAMSGSQLLRIEDDAIARARDEARDQLGQLQLIADALQRENEELRHKLTSHDPSDTAIGMHPDQNVPRADLESLEAAYAALQMQVKRFQIERDQERSRFREQSEELRRENERLRIAAPNPTAHPEPGDPGEGRDLRELVEILRKQLVAMHVEQDAERQAWQQRLAAMDSRPTGRVLATDAEIRQIVEQIDLLHQENEELRQNAMTREGANVQVDNHSRAPSMLEHQMQSLQSEILMLKGQLHERDRTVEELQRQAGTTADPQSVQSLRQALHRLQDDLADRDALIEKMSVELDSPMTTANLENSGGYERELHEFRLELERDRRVLNEQLGEIQLQQQDIDDAARETELQLARERATIARERNELNRLRDEIRMDQERLARQANKQQANVPSVGSLREALNSRKQQDGEANGSRRR